MNWELPSELKTPILQQKYPDRAIIRVTDNCLSYCNYCYMAHRTLDRGLPLAEALPRAWPETLEYLRNSPQVRDVLISGGDPLLLSNSRIDRILRDLREIPSVRTVRLNTRALTHNPFRFDDDLANILAQHRLTVLEIHIAHPREITPELGAALESLDGPRRPLVLWRSPLLRSINDSEEVMEELLLSLYELRVTPYYLFHFAPNSPGRANLGTPIRRGVDILSSLRRRIPGPATPRYTLFHPSGKHDIPLNREGTADFRYVTVNGRAFVEFTNWRGQLSLYPDVRDEDL